MRDVRLLATAFDPAFEIERFTAAHPQSGGVVSFLGQVREGGGVEALELRHYPPLTLPGMEVLAEAVLSYVGVGVDPGTISYGVMINNARGELAREPMVWWTLAAAFGFMLVLVLAANLFADAVRDAFDPRLNRTGDAK